MSTLWLDKVHRARNHLSMTFGCDQHRFEVAYWYDDVDLQELEARFGQAFMDRLYFHMLAFEALKVTSLNPDGVDLGPFERFHDDAFEALWQQLYQHIWAQWRYENHLPHARGPAFVHPARADQPSPQRREHHNPVEMLAFCGGGKDSLVAMQVLEDAGLAHASFAYSHSIYGNAAHQHQLIAALQDHGPAQARHRLWIYDSFLDSPVASLCGEYGVNSLTAAETPTSLFAALPVILQHDYRYAVLAHERSANVGNLIWDLTGEEVNHQWGKSFAAEQLLNTYLQRTFLSDFSYFSLLQPVHDVVIFNALRRNVDAVLATHSCNLRKPWCGECPKCAYVWLNYMAYLPEDRIQAMFGRNLLDLAANQLWFRQMLGLAEHTPFECIGQVAETRLAFELCRRKGLNGAAMELFVQECPAPTLESLRDPYLGVDTRSHNMPPEVAGRVLPVLRQAALDATEYLGDWLGRA